MPRQSRVSPFGDIVALPARGTSARDMRGNGGSEHDTQSRIRRPYRLSPWIYRLLEFNGRRRVVVSPGRNIEPPFLDEATALAAASRPCAKCPRGRYKEFVRC